MFCRRGVVVTGYPSAAAATARPQVELRMEVSRATGSAPVVIAGSALPASGHVRSVRPPPETDSASHRCAPVETTIARIPSRRLRNHRSGTPREAGETSAQVYRHRGCRPCRPALAARARDIRPARGAAVATWEETHR